MDLNECIKQRRTSNKFLNKKINKFNLNKILDSIRYAPNSGNLQNWRLIVVEKEENKKKLAKASFNQEWIKQAPIIIVICSDKKDIERFYNKSQAKKYATQNCAAGIQNMLLTAHSLNISSCWNAISDPNLIKETLKIPEDIDLEAILCFGYSTDKLKIPKRIDFEKIIHFNEW